jgi:hypothetical protein
MQRKLRDNQQFAINGRERQVHLAGLVGKDAQARDAVLDIFGIAGRIAFANAKQDHETARDAPDYCAVNPDFGVADTLNNCPHSTPSLFHD